MIEMNESTYRFKHPFDGDLVTVASQFQAERLLLPHLINEEQAKEIVGTKVVNNTPNTLLLEQMLEGDHGPGAKLCAVIHMKALNILCRTEMHFDDLDEDSFDETGEEY